MKTLILIILLGITVYAQPEKNAFSAVQRAIISSTISDSLNPIRSSIATKQPTLVQ